MGTTVRRKASEGAEEKRNDRQHGRRVMQKQDNKETRKDQASQWAPNAKIRTERTFLSKWRLDRVKKMSAYTVINSWRGQIVTGKTPSLPARIIG